MERRWMRGPLPIVLVVWLVGMAAAVAQATALRLKDSMTAADFERCGLYKLKSSELAALEAWLATRVPNTSSPAAGVAFHQLGGAGRDARGQSTEIVVAFNTSNGKYHCPSCQWALRCTRNCVNIPLSEARARGVPCKVCRGSCR